jgi:molecular chaperone DnaK
MVAYQDGQWVVGTRATELLEWFPQRVAVATKRYIGQRWSEEIESSVRGRVPYRLLKGERGEIRVGLEGVAVPLTQVSALILSELFLDAQAHWGKPVRKAVITVPANFDDGQRQATKEAASIAGLELLRIINEPTAAALAFGFAKKFTGKAVIFDLGGGTLDVTVLEIQDGVFEVRATGGHPFLGGEDFDNRVIEWLLSQVPLEVREGVANDPLCTRRLRTAAERAKRELTSVEETQITVADLKTRSAKESTQLDVTLTREAFDSMCAPLWRRSLDVCDRVLSDAKLLPDQIDAVLMVGGMTRAPRIKQLLTGLFGREPVGGVNPDEVVAVGAAIQAEEIGNQQGARLLLDVASHSLGVGFVGTRVRRLVAKNTPIPVTAKECFIPVRAAQKEARIPIYQGESNLVAESTKLGEVLLTGLGVADRSNAPIEVSFELGADGTLTVKALHPLTKEESVLKILARTELSPEELGQLKEDQAKRVQEQSEKDFAQCLDILQELIEQAYLLELEDGERVAIDKLIELAREALEAKVWPMVATASRHLTRLLRLSRG